MLAWPNWSVCSAEDLPQTPHKGDSAAAAAKGGAEAEPGPLAAGLHDNGSVPKAAETPILAPASQLGPGFVATPEKPAATEEAPKPSLFSGAAQETSTGAAALPKDAEAEGSAEQEGPSQPVVMSMETGSAAGPLPQAAGAAAAPQDSTTKEPASADGAEASSCEADG